MFRPATIAVPVVARQRLLSRIVGPGARKVTVVKAPPGYGKTVLLTQAYDAIVESGRPCLWLSANGAVSDASLIELLSIASDHAGIPPALDDDITLYGLLDRIERALEPVSVIIDGLDRDMPEGANALLGQLIGDAPPDTRFLIATETALRLPEVRWEASGLLRRIDMSDLAFVEDDIVALRQATDVPAWMGLLNHRVDGWPAIVQLALNRFGENPGSAMPMFNGCRHDIATFIEQEVLRNVAAQEFDRLMDASVVDQVCGTLLDALSGGNDGSAVLGRFLAWGVPMRESSSREWFQLHPLVRDYLYDRLRRHDVERLTLLHQRAANWLLSFGDQQAALRHGTASGDIEFLRDIYQNLNVGQALLPEQVEVAEDRPSIARDVALEPKWRGIFDLIQSGQLDQARDAISDTRQQAPIVMAAEQPDFGPAEWELIYSDLLMRVFDDRLPRPDQLEILRDRMMRTPGVPPSIPAAVSELVIVSRFRRGDLSGVAEADRNLWHTSALAPTQSKIYVLLELAIAALELGDLDLATRHLNNARARAWRAFGPTAPHAYAASTLLAEVAYERGDRAASADLLNRSFSEMQPGEIWFNLAASAFTTLSAGAAYRSWSDALEALELPPSVAAHSGLWRLPPLMIAQRLRLATLWNEDLEAARKDRATLSNMGLLDLGELDSAGYGWRVSIPAQLAVIRFDLADRQAEAALARSIALRSILEVRGYVRRLIELNLLQGRASIETGDHAAGYALARAALKLSVDSGMVQSFLDEARFLETLIGELLLSDELSAEELAFLGAHKAGHIRPAIRQARYVSNGRVFDLSGREDQLMRALVTGKTFKEISFALNISINTIKMHRVRLYRKLGCNSRSHAIALAQELVNSSEAPRADVDSASIKTGARRRSLEPCGSRVEIALD